MAQQQHRMARSPSLAPQQRYDHDVCRSDAQCLNGGRCRGGDTFGSYTYCACPSGYGGDRCEDHCPLECLNGGRCIANNNWSSSSGTEKKTAATYHCKCLGLFTGSVCSLSYVNCSDGNRCYNGGMCLAARASSLPPSTATATTTTTTTTSATTCACPDGYVGPTCRTSTTTTSLVDAAVAAGSLSSTVLALSAAVAAMGLVVGVVVAFRARRRMRPMRRRRRGVRGSSNHDDSDDYNVEPCYYAGVEMLEGKDENEHDDEGEEEQEQEEVEEQEQEEIMLNRNIV
jgi:hypothetical protein